MTRQRPQTFAENADPLDNVASFEPRTEKPTISVEEARRIGEASGFSARETEQRAPTPIIDARSLRTTNRTAQLNVSVTPETKNRFWRYAQENGFGAGEEALVALLSLAALDNS